MDVILDTNIFIADRKMAGNKFQELFNYLRRKGSRLVIPEVVFSEVLARYRDELTRLVQAAAAAWEKMRGMAVEEPEALEGPDVDWQVTRLREKLLKPAPGVETLLYTDFSGVDAQEVVRRGVYRIRPASSEGEELRDVVVWMMLLHYAKKSGAEVAFITKDKGFAAADGAGLHSQLASDIANAGVCVSFYTDIGAFVTENSLQTDTAKEDWLYTVVERRSIEKLAIENLRTNFPHFGNIEDVALDHLSLSSGKRYKVAEESVYVELLFSGSSRLSVRQTTFVFPAQFVPGEAVVINSGLTRSYETTFPGTAVYNLLGTNTSYVPAVLGAGTPWQGNAVPQANVFVADPHFEGKSVETVYRCEFGLALSARIEGNKLIALQTDGFEVRKAEAVPNLVAGG